MKQKITTAKAPNPAGPYSQGIRVANRVYVAGQGPLNVETGEVAESVYEQTKQVLKNIAMILEAGGVSMNDVVKVTAHLADLGDFAEFNRAYAECFEEPFPVRTTVQSGLNNILVEIDVVAEVG